MTLFVNKTADSLSTKLNKLVDNFSKKMTSYESPSDKAIRNESLPNALMLAGSIIAVVGVPAGAMVGKYFNEMGAGIGLSAIIPAGMIIGAGLISHLNNKALVEYVHDRDIDLPLKAKHNEKHGNDFLKKLDELNIGESFKEIKSIVDDSVKNPPSHQENVVKDVQKTLKKNNLQ